MVRHNVTEVVSLDSAGLAQFSANASSGSSTTAAAISAAGTPHTPLSGGGAVTISAMAGITEDGT